MPNGNGKEKEDAAIKQKKLATEGSTIPEISEIDDLASVLKPRREEYGESAVRLQITIMPGLTSEELASRLKNLKYDSSLGEEFWTEDLRDYFYSWPEEKMANALANLLKRGVIKYTTDETGKKRYYSN